MKTLRHILATCALTLSLIFAAPVTTNAQYFHCTSEDYYELLNILNAGPQYSYEVWDHFYGEEAARCGFPQVVEREQWVAAYSTGGFEGNWDATWEWLSMQVSGS